MKLQIEIRNKNETNHKISLKEILGEINLSDKGINWNFIGANPSSNLLKKIAKETIKLIRINASVGVGGISDVVEFIEPKVDLTQEPFGVVDVVVEIPLEDIKLKIVGSNRVVVITFF